MTIDLSRMRVQIWTIDRPLPYIRNARTHTDEQVAQVAASIREFGWTNPLLVAGDGTIIAGHARLAAARKLKMTEVPVIVLDHLTDAQRRALVLADKGPLGTVELNIILQRLIQKKLFGVDVAEVEPGRRAEFLPGDKVIQTKNDYDLGVMNGVLGYVIENHPKDGLSVDFEGTIVEIPKDSAKEYNLQLAYATSIHKMQGSEFPCAVVVTHKSHAFMHHRNLLYTAVTRAQKSVIILGDHWGVENCAKKQQVDKRNTFLSFLLHDARRLE